MSWVQNFARSSIGAKVVMALSGLVIVGFVIGHMLGNLQIFLGQDALNAYAANLHAMPPLLWGTRIVVGLSIIAHVLSAIRLSLLNQAARPERYARKAYVRATLGSRTMRLSALVLLAFVIYHLLHFTLGVTHPDHKALVDAAGRPDVYSMVILGFQQPIVAISYVVAMLLLGLHLSHGASSMFQSLGLHHPQYNGFIDNVGPVLAGIIVVGNCSMPLAVLLGALTLPGGM